MYKAITLLGASLLAASSVTAAMKNADAQDRFDFAVKRNPAWTLTATTHVDWAVSSEASYPKVASVECTGESAQFSFGMNSSGDLDWLRTRLLGKADEDGDREEITHSGDRIWLYIDGERWEYARIPSHSDEFSNISYPPPDTSIMVGPWHGFHAVRKAADQPWINFDLLNHRLITAKQIEWRFKSRNWADLDKEDVESELGENWQTTRYRIDNEGLNDAIFWCARQVSSKNAYNLPDEILESRAFAAQGGDGLPTSGALPEPVGAMECEAVLAKVPPLGR